MLGQGKQYFIYFDSLAIRISVLFQLVHKFHYTRIIEFNYSYVDKYSQYTECTNNNFVNTVTPVISAVYRPQQNDCFLLF